MSCSLPIIYTYIREACFVLEKIIHGATELHESAKQHQQKALEAISEVVRINLRHIRGADESKTISHDQLVADELVERAVLVETVRQSLKVRVGNQPALRQGLRLITFLKIS